MKEVVLEVKNLTKDFDGELAVDGISFGIEKGEILGLLGPNGAGKTTTIMMLLGVTKPTSGEIKIFGLNLATHRQEIANRINFSSPYISLPDRLTPFENLYVFAALYGISNPRDKIRRLLNDFDLADMENELTLELSSGQLTRLNLCKALLNDPELLFLDEPTASLDPEIALKIRDLLFKIRRETHISMLYTSHNMEEVSRMCDRVIFLNKGKIVASDTPLNLTRMIEDYFLTITFDAPLEKVKNFGLKKKLDFDIPQPNILEIKIKEKDVGPILTQLARDGIDICNVAIKNPDLEDVFLKISSTKK